MAVTPFLHFISGRLTLLFNRLTKHGVRARASSALISFQNLELWYSLRLHRQGDWESLHVLRTVQYVTKENTVFCNCGEDSRRHEISSLLRTPSFVLHWLKHLKGS